MTREEAIRNLEMIKIAFVDPVTKEQRKLINDTLDMAISALSVPEREKGKICKDCNLCQVTDLKDWLATCNNPNSKKYLNFVKKYESCDVPEREKGEWIKFKDFEEGYFHIKCSKCGQYWSIADHAKIFKFCFNCGADMRKQK